MRACWWRQPPAGSPPGCTGARAHLATCPGKAGSVPAAEPDSADSRDDFGRDARRQLTFVRPDANLHVRSPGAIEPQRHLLFVRWLTDPPGDRDRYAAAKLEAAGTDRARPYNDLKSATVYDIYERAFPADPSYEHDPRPREHSGPMEGTVSGRG